MNTVLLAADTIVGADSSANPPALVLVGAGWVIVGALFMINARRRRLRSVQVPGMVIGQKIGSGENGLVYFPSFRFTTIEGNEVEVTSSYGGGSAPQPGQNVTVLYDPRKPQRAKIDTPDQTGLAMGRILFGFGLVLTVLGVLTAFGIL